MTPFHLKTFINRFPVLKNTARFFFKLYENSVWNLFTLYFKLYGRHRFFTADKPKEVRSVLHVSVLSHKPYMLSLLMRQKGLKSEYMAVHAESGWLQVGDKGYDYNIPWNMSGLIFRPFITLHFFWNIMRRYDVIHYHFASFLTYDGRELFYLKLMGKVIVVHFRGCDLRQKSENNMKNPELNCCQECEYPNGSCENEDQMLRIRLARKYADLLFVTTPDLLDFLPEAEHIPFIMPFGVDINNIEPAPRTPGTFRVVTSSNHDSVDGTKYIRNAVKRLQREGRSIELIEVHNTPYEKALSIYKSADIYAGKLLMGYYNNANIECMMMGVPCLSYIRDEFFDRIPDCPIIITRPETVYQKLCEYMDKPEDLQTAANKGIAFVKKYHDPDIILRHLIKRYNEVLQSF
ncbi:MAG: glycosyltransferase [Candidatus Latescibacteria bacterium]|nr:glycosyltransferase [Candidatus Latescibacterota bacterium]